MKILKVLWMLCIRGACLKILLGCSKFLPDPLEYPPMTIVIPLRCPGMTSWYEVLASQHSVAPCDKTSSWCCNSYNVKLDLLLFP